MSLEIETKTAEQHGVRHAFYSNLPGPQQTAILECLCGEEVTGQTPSWEDAGYQMDLHLERVTSIGTRKPIGRSVK